jgi:signal transduction histidine kinase
MDEDAGTETHLRRRHNETLARLVEHSPFGIYLVDADFRLALVSAGARPTFAGVEPLIGRDLAEVLRTLWPEPFATEALGRFRHTLDTGEPYRSADTTERRRDVDAVESYDWQLERLTLPDGRFGVVCHYYDATRLRQSERARRESEEKLRALFDAIDEGFCVVEVLFDGEGRPVGSRLGETNAAFEKCGDLRDATGWTLRDLVAGRDRAWLAWCGRVAATGEAARTTAGGAAVGRWWDVYASRIGGPDSREVAVVFDDVTERRRDERQLRRSEQHYRALATASSDVAYRMSADWSVMLPLDGRELVQSNDEPLDDWGWLTRNLPPEEHARVRAAIATAIEGRTLFELEHRVHRPDGSVGWTLSRAVPILGEGEEIVEWLGAATDVTDRKRAEAARQGLLERERAAREAAELAGRMKDEFLATLSHELRTPLNAILGWSRLLQAGVLPEDKRAHALLTIDRNARAQVALIEDILDVSRIATGKLRLDVAPVEPAQVIEAALDTVRHAADARGVRIEVVLDPDVRGLRGDATRLQQIFWNLLSNAVKFTPKGGRVRVRLEPAGSSVRVVVADTGRGIEPGFLPHLFETFRQEDGSTTRQHGGLGLGLSIVKHLVEMHGGTVHAESEGLGRGATFTVLLPAPASRVPLLPPRTAVIARAGSALYCPPALAGLRVLACDDEADARDLLRSVFELCAATVTTVGSAADALAALRAGSFDVLVSDIGMPDDDGYALIRRVRALPAEEGGRVPAVALTAYAAIADRTRALASGYQAHAIKPIDPQELIVVIAGVLGTGSDPGPRPVGP